MKDSEKIALATQTVQFMVDNDATLKAAGFDPAIMKASLESKIADAIAKEEEQATAFATYKEVTDESQAMTEEVYTLASRVIDSASGALGKKHPLVDELRKRRKR